MDSHAWMTIKGWPSTDGISIYSHVWMGIQEWPPTGVISAGSYPWIAQHQQQQQRSRSDGARTLCAMQFAGASQPFAESLDLFLESFQSSHANGAYAVCAKSYRSIPKCPEASRNVKEPLNDFRKEATFYRIKPRRSKIIRKEVVLKGAFVSRAFRTSQKPFKVAHETHSHMASKHSMSGES